MALGNTYDNNKEKEIFHPTVYGYAMGNTKSEIDASQLSHSMWKGTMKISIAPKIGTSDDDERADWDRKNAAMIYLNHTKARIFAEILKGFLVSPEEFNQRGVPAGAGLITISNGEEFDKPNTPVLVIKKIGQNGQVESSYAYEFKRDYHYAITSFDEKTGDFERDFESFANLEIQQLITQLESYYQAMTGCVAFSVVDNMAYNQHQLNENLNKIASGVGVELYKQKSSKGSGSYFNNGNKSVASGGGSNRSNSTIDDIMAEED